MKKESFFEKNVIATSIYPEISKISKRIDFKDLKTLLPKFFNVYYEVFIRTIKFKKIVFIILDDKATLFILLRKLYFYTSKI